MQEEKNQSPLVNFTMKMILEGETQIKADFIPKITSILQDFVSGKISIKECSVLLYPFLENMEPVERLNDILQLPDIPNSRNVHLNTRSKTRSWSFFEDQKLLAGIHKFGTGDWKNIALYVGNRTKSQCSQRWFRCLDPRIKKEQWTKNQDERLISLIAKNGTRNWTAISFEIGNRSDIQCRYRYKQLLKDPDFLEKLAEAQEKLEKVGKISLAPRKIDSTHEMMNSYGQNAVNHTGININSSKNVMEMNVINDLNRNNCSNPQNSNLLIPSSHFCLINNNQKIPNFTQTNFPPIIQMATQTTALKPGFQNKIPLQFPQTMQPPTQFPKMPPIQQNQQIQSAFQNQTHIPMKQPMLLYQQMPNANLMNIQPSPIVYSSPTAGVTPPLQQQWGYYSYQVGGNMIASDV
ncbi:hypothetical protein TRFO_29523 [Tritrichomonas foetus]|uniref:Myb-like DNA-binding domain containing protein n=1 Tax=Tritrichomonas foetus TaxID=1144522 RepID=A0A1J4JVP2_9EUKA|nr:hypothetical protein TRFO_29523 [Tritrichomonas foetus]|eukprot:OHT03209.1 hypothetical protein TRFO_29523 [Tritrichomonas foetus]